MKGETRRKKGGKTPEFLVRKVGRRRKLGRKRRKRRQRQRETRRSQANGPKRGKEARKPGAVTHEYVLNCNYTGTFSL